MNNYNVIIPCSGPGTRSSPYTKFHKALNSIGNTAVLDHIIKSYSNPKTIYIMLGYHDLYVKQYIEHAGYTNVEFIDIPNWGESQFESLRQLPEHVFDMPFYLNSCDNWSPNVPEVNTNTAFLCNPINSDYYDITDNGNVFAGIGYVRDSQTFYALLHASTDTRNEYNLYRGLDGLQEVVLDEWFDVGNKDSYTISKSSFKDKIPTLDKLHQEIYITNDRVIKLFAHDTTKLKEVISGATVHPHIQPVSYTDNALSYKFVERVDDFNRVLDNLNRYWEYALVNSVKTNNVELWQNKTIERFETMLDTYPELCNTLSINGTKLDAIRVFESIDWSVLNNGILAQCHGDMIYENVVAQKDKIEYIDHRSSNVNDIFYDICKFYQNLFINNNTIPTYSIEKQNNNYNISISEYRSERIKCFESLDIFKQYEYKIKLGAYCMWLGMAPLNTDNDFNIFLFLYGLEHINKL